MTEKILAALAALDVANDAHWTEEGSPRMDVLKASSGLFALTRDQVTLAAPGFSRAALQASLQAKAEAEAKAKGDTPAQEGATQPPAAPGNAAETQSATPPAASVPAVLAAPPAAQVVRDVFDQAPQAEPQGKEELAQELETAEARLVDATRAKNEADQAFAKASQEADRLREACEKVHGKEPLSVTLDGYFANQRRLLEERREKQLRMKGIDIKELLPKKAPIDQAFARKTARGTGRPGSGS